MSKKRGQITPGLGNRLRQIREQAHLTREDVAEKAGISTRHLAAIELVQKNPSVDTLYRLIRVLGISADSVFYPELVQEDSSLSLIHRMAGTCSSVQQNFLVDFIKLLQNPKYGNLIS